MRDRVGPGGHNDPVLTPDEASYKAQGQDAITDAIAALRLLKEGSFCVPGVAVARPHL